MTYKTRISLVVVLGGLAAVSLALAGIRGDAGEASPDGSVAVAAAAGADAVPVAAHAGVAQEFEYVGGRSGCRRCHLREFRSWEDTPHASALETLPEEERSNAECLQCHTTGFGEPTGFQSAEATPELASVGCEVCHGPGSAYRDRDVMESREASIAAGMKIPDEETCRGCHNEHSPTFPGSFDYAEMLERGVHERTQ